MMKLLLATIALLVASAYGGIPQVTYPSNITSMNVTGIEVVLLDGPAWVTQIEESWGSHEFFVYGDMTLRSISAGFSGFYAMPDLDPLSYPLIDLHTFFYVNNASGHLIKLTLGMSDFNPFDSGRFTNVAGPYLPLFSASLDLNATGTTSQQYLQPNVNNVKANPNLTGFLPYAIRCDEWSLRSSNQVIAYYAGFMVSNNTINFVLVRTYYDLAFSFTNVQFTFNPSVDVFTLYPNQFTSFNEAYKPWVHLLLASNGHNVTIVVDPNTQSIYSVDLTTGFINSMNLVTTANNDTILYQIVSTAYDFMSGKLVVGFATNGLQPGFISIFNLAASTPGANYTIPLPGLPIYLPGNYSNPKALALDNDAVYIGLNGVGEALKYNLTTTAFTYQRLPEFLHRSWSAIVRREHVYFSTYEQNSKVFRIHKQDFCDSPCPYWGYCSQAQCTCYEGFQFSSDKTQCVLTAAEKETIYEKEYKTAHGGEIALGILFALSFVAAAAGWFMWWRARHGAYQAV